MLGNIIVSCAEAPALGLIDGQPFEIVPPKFQPLDFRGAGDSMTAALADWLISLVAFARRAADRQVGVVFVIS